MKLGLLNHIFSPCCHEKLNVTTLKEGHGEVQEGNLTCVKCSSTYPIKNYIPRFIGIHNYSESWGQLWKETGELLKDSYTGIPWHYEVIYGEYSEENSGQRGKSPFGFNWPKDMSGQKILEVGPGTGNLSENLIRSGAEVFSIDMSHAIDCFPESLLTQPNIHVIQGDINSGIFPQDHFDRIWLFQVLQHTPNPKETLKNLKVFLKEGGQIAFTSYRNDRQYNPLYHRILKKMDPKVSWKLVCLYVPLFLPLKYWGQKFFAKLGMPLATKLAEKLFAPVDPRNVYYETREGLMKDYYFSEYYNKTRNDDYLLKFTIINTYDRVTPNYQVTGEHSTIEKWCQWAGYKEVKTWGKGGVRAIAWK